MLSNTKYDGIPKWNLISGRRARLALLRRKDNGAREASHGPWGKRGAVRSPSSALVLPMPLKVPPKNIIISTNSP